MMNKYNHNRGRSRADKSSGRRNRKKSSKIHRQKKKQQQQQPSLQELLHTAATAETAMDAEGAYTAYSQASQQLLISLGTSTTSTQLDGATNDDDVTMNTNISHHEGDDSQQQQQQHLQEQQMLLIQIFQKMGELQVSLNEPDQARTHFVDAIHRLEATQQQQQSQANASASAAAAAAGTSPSTTTTTTPQSLSSLTTYYETHANLCFYIGQSSLAHEGLDAYNKGISSLEQCIQIVKEQQVSNTDDIDDDRMEEDDNDNAENDNNSVLLYLQELNQKLSGAYCNIAELYLTDLCLEDHAETECERYLQRALTQVVDQQDGSPYVDALQTMASLRLSQQDPIDRRLEAVPYILQAYAKQRIGTEALAALVGLADKTNPNDQQQQQQQSNSTKHDGDMDDSNNDDDDDENGTEQAKELVEVDAANNLPEFEFRCQTAKLLMECAALLKDKRLSINSEKSTVAPSTVDYNGGNQTELSNEYFRKEHECITSAVSVLGSLLAQNDEIIEIWYLTGCAFAAKTPPAVEAATFYLERAKEMLLKIRKSIEQDLQYVDNDDDERAEMEQELEMNANQMEDVQNKLSDLPVNSMNEMMEHE